MVQELSRPAKPLPRGAAPDTAWAFFNGEFVPLKDAKVSVLTHAFNYGTGVFEGVRAYWNADHEQLYGLHLIEHYRRLHKSCKVMRLDLAYSPERLVEITLELLRKCGYREDCYLRPLVYKSSEVMRLDLPYSPERLVEITLELLRKCGYREDCYLRPLVYKSSEVIGVRLHDLESAFTVFAVPFGTYIDIDRGISCGVSSWRRVDDNAIPARSKITGSYVNAALAKTEAQEAGYDEAIVLTNDGHVSEGSAENLFMVRNGTLITPPVSDNILEGIVRASVVRIAGDLKVPLEIRSIDRTELYIADELFLCGTGAQLAPVTSVDHRAVGEGTIGPITQQLSRVYFDAVHGKSDRYREWVTPVYTR